MSPRRKRVIFPIVMKVMGWSVVGALVAGGLFLLMVWFTLDPAKLMPERGVPTPLDGAGQAAVAPDLVKENELVGDMTISYTTGHLGLMEGAGIHLFYPAQVIVHGEKSRLYVPYLAWGSINRFRNAPIRVTTTGQAELKVENPSWFRALRLYFGYYRSKWKNGHPAYSVRDIARELCRRTIKVEEGELKPGEEVTFHIGVDEGFRAPCSEGWMNFAVSVDGDGDGVAKLISSAPRLVIVGKKATHFKVTATSVLNIWERAEVVVEAVDEHGHVDPTYTGTVYLDAPELALPGKTEFKLSDLGRKSFSMRTSKKGRFFIVARDMRGRRGRSNPIVVREKGMHLYWGDFHVHSVLGMGDNSPEFLLRKARNHLGLDFVSVNMIDNGVPLASHDELPSWPEVEFGWAHLQKITHLFHKEREFLVFPAYIWASNSQGFRLVVYSTDEVNTELFSHTDENYDTVKELLEALADKKAVAIPIWSGWRGGEFMGKRFNWGPVDDATQRLVEVYSSDGAVEFHDNPFPIHGSKEVPRLFGPSDQASNHYGAFVRDGLAKGHKMGLVAGGARKFSFDRTPFYSAGLTAVWAENLTERSVWEAVYQRRAYGTTGARIFVDFKVNGQFMGSTVKAGKSAVVYVHVVGTAPIDYVQVWKYEEDFEISRTLESETEYLNSRWIDEDPPNGGFYYLRVRQVDGHMAWAGPVWVER